MTAPARTRPAPARRAPRTAPAARASSTARPSSAGRPSSTGRSVAAQRAYSRKSERSQRWTHLVPDPLAKAVVARRVPFVAIIIGLLGVGLFATLWLSANSAEDSYQLSSAQKETRLLAERVEALHRDVATMSSAAALAQRAAQLGMVPTTDVARLLVAPDGAVAVVGKPAPAALPVSPPPVQARSVAPTITLAAPAPAVLPAPAPALVGASAPVGAPTPLAISPQAHSEQIEPGATPVPANGGA
ncbi:MAG: hypothetical protein ACXVGA_02730 [Mycobacteriaceae bacterium]